MRLSSSFAALTLLACQVAAHSTFQQLWINNVDAGSSCIRMPNNNNPVEGTSNSALACNNASSSQGICPVKAGDSLTVEMHAQPGQRSCGNEAIGGQHYGPVIVYMAKVDNAATASATSAGWFKVSEGGLMSNSPNWWAVQTLNANCGHWTFKVPSDLAPGNYLVRAEVIALHVAGSSGGAQFYPACFQINLSGSGNASPPTVRFPGAYAANDPGILVNIHQSLATYKIPGPTPYGSSPATVGNSPYPTTATWNTAQQPQTVPTVVPGGGGSPTSAGTTVINTTPTPTPTSGGGGGTVALYGQCGGTGWTGGTSCAQGKCTVINSFYSQCLP